MTTDHEPSRATAGAEQQSRLERQPPERPLAPAGGTDLPPVATADGRPRTSLRAKLPELALEATSVVFAVLLALAVDEWRDDRAEQRRAQRARAAIEHELHANAVELDASLAANRAAVERLRSTIAAVERGEAVEVGLTYQLAELSSAAWDSARLTGAVGGLELDWLIGVSRLYEVQRLYVEGQQQLADRLAGMGEAIGAGDPQPVLGGLAGRADNLLALGEKLRERYGQHLAAPVGAGGSGVERSP